jgi:hypothetical protein
VIDLIYGFGYVKFIVVGLLLQVIFSVLDCFSYKSRGFDYARALYNAYMTKL